MLPIHNANTKIKSNNLCCIASAASFNSPPHDHPLHRLDHPHDQVNVADDYEDDQASSGNAVLLDSATVRTQKRAAMLIARAGRLDRTPP